MRSETQEFRAVRGKRRIGVGRIRLVSALVAVLAIPLAGVPASASAAAPGAITTIAGGGTDYPGDGGAATSAGLINSSAVALDGAGNVLIADHGDLRVLLVAGESCSSACAYGLASMTRGNIYTIAGTGSYGDSGDGGPAKNAELYSPSGLAIDSAGNVLIADTNNDRIRMIAAADCAADCRYGLSPTVKNDIYTIAGMATEGFSGDGLPATSAELDQPLGLAVDGAGDLIIADVGNSRVRMVAGSSCLTGCPYGLMATTKGDIYTVAGTGVYGFSGDGGAATAADLSSPSAVTVDAAGDVLIADANNGAVRVLEAASCASGCPYGLSSMATGRIDTIAGDGDGTYSGDGGPATSAGLVPSGVAVDDAGNVLIADSYNNRVRVIAAADCPSRCDYGLASTVAGSIYTVAGTGTRGFSGDNGPPTAAELYLPEGLALDAHGNVFITAGDRVREVIAEAWLSVNEDGTGSGRVTGSGIDCPGSCTRNTVIQYPVTLTATPAAGSTFTGWTGGGCTGTSPCTVTVNGDTNVNATFTKTPAPPPRTLTVTLGGIGHGTVTGGQINCPGTCSQTAQGGSTITLTATPAPGSTFNGWTGGGCTGTGPCTTTINGDTAVTATFNPTVSQCKATLTNALKPTGNAAKLHPLLKAGGYALTFSAPCAGALAVRWYLVPHGAHLAAAKHKHPKPILIATGTATANQAGNVKLTVKLTRAGRAKLALAHRLKLTALATFTPLGGTAVKAIAAFTLKR
jgi:hypothetical protein